MKKKTPKMKIKLILLIIPCMALIACTTVKKEPNNERPLINNNTLNLNNKNTENTLTWSEFFDEISSNSELKIMESNLDEYNNSLENKINNTLINKEKNIDNINLNKVSEERNDIYKFNEDDEADELLDIEPISENNTNIANKLISLFLSSPPTDNHHLSPDDEI
ncbi:TPA: hypothetical protein U2J54_002648 [Providencia rettgeri]|uniref:hypothetical protein n=1 Tax=Providencia TaxID=586 RepID=UPI00234AEB03|nr:MULTISPECIES: hypothetical protein [Providencia]EJD6044324.1 hypothetical protein [Providencia rettgeri]EJD6411797.1 hypothetical protein [Providencia rettgeri]EJD6540809.1 hypothetical protein [Providencia rettgeri]EJD6672780.1 hypothetical protein [Providencia rettgeri]ELQ1458103.1 hypothetical protein [Providencia rettgeri]